MAEEGKLVEGHCKILLAITDKEKQYQVALKMVDEKDTIREADERVKKELNKKAKKDEKYAAIYKDIEDTFQGFFGTKVKLDAGPKRGKIIIQYTSNDDLERILDLIKG